MSISTDGRQANGPSLWPAISGDGQVVVFESEADNLDGADNNGLWDIYAATINDDTPPVEANPLPPLVHTAFNPIDGNTTPEQGVLYGDATGEARVTFKDSLSKQRLGDVEFSAPGFTPLQLSRSGDVNGNGSDEVAVLFSGADGRGVVQLRNSVSGDWIRELSFVGQRWQVRSLAVTDANTDGRDDVAVLAISDDGQSAGIQIRDAINGNQLNWIGLPKSQDSDYIDLARVPDLDGNGADELAALHQYSDGRIEVLIRDSQTKQQVGRVDFRQQSLPAVSLTVLPDINANGSPEVALLLKQPRRTRHCATA